MEPEASLPQSQVPATCPYPEPDQSRSEAYSLTVSEQDTFFYCEELLAPRPTPKLEDHPLSALRDFVFNIFAATLPAGGRSSIRSLNTRHAGGRGPTGHGQASKQTAHSGRLVEPPEPVCMWWRGDNYPFDA